ncbi:TetR family transcriptional regulator [Gordonia sp. SID5947]|uniref:TetR family transcriptional regulator n=1 Tax=Gordonia sp. SID5947 TaxID=2690315 RepID=UPI00137104D8|nr:TetR family transcriptional regulator [Gordonia sp. SID5947]
MTTRGRPPRIGRDEIVTATLEVLRDRGIARLTTREIADRLGISEGSIFYHFGDRKGLVGAVFTESLRPLWEFGPMMPSAPHDISELREVLTVFTTRLEEFLEDGLDVLMAAQADTALRAELGGVILENDYGPQRGVTAISGYLRSAQAAGVIAPTVDAEVTAHLLIASVFMRYAQPMLVGHARGLPSRDRTLDFIIATLRH